MPNSTDSILNSAEDTIYLVDDDFHIRESLVELLDSLGYVTLAFDSAASFLNHTREDHGACMILDLQLPDISGLDLQRRLNDEASLPIIFISGHTDVPMTVKAMKAGAIEFLTKPIHEQHLIGAIRVAIAKDRRSRQRKADISVLHKHLDSLTPREREVFVLLWSGLLNKQAASLLGISEVTVQAHRGQIMRKMNANSFAELIRMGTKAGLKAIDVNARERTLGKENAAHVETNDRSRG